MVWGCRVLGLGFRIVKGFRVWGKGLGFGVEDLGLGFGVKGWFWGCRGLGLEFRVWI
jgi:hypothetical protein